MGEIEIDRLYLSVGINIRNKRRLRSITQQKLADDLRMSRVSIVNIEKGRQRPSLHMLVQLSTLFNCSIDDLVEVSEIPQQNTDWVDQIRGFDLEVSELSETINFIKRHSNDQ